MKSGYDFLTAAGRSDTGRVRDHNEDSIKVDREAGWFCVADGMGGEEAGEVASREVVEAIRDELALLPDAAGANNLAKKEKSNYFFTMPCLMLNDSYLKA